MADLCTRHLKPCLPFANSSGQKEGAWVSLSWLQEPPDISVCLYLDVAKHEKTCTVWWSLAWVMYCTSLLFWIKLWACGALYISPYLKKTKTFFFLGGGGVVVWKAVKKVALSVNKHMFIHICNISATYSKHRNPSHEGKKQQSSSKNNARWTFLCMYSLSSNVLYIHFSTKPL